MALVFAQCVLLSASAGPSGAESAVNPLRPPVNSRRNVEDFPATGAKFVRFTVFKTNEREPCVDELEVYPEGHPGRNVALASNGGLATASGFLPGYEIHKVQYVNDGLYGNAHSWIADGISNVWIQIELSEATNINRVVWGRDREGYLIDRLATAYRIEVSEDGKAWKTVASSADRSSLPAGSVFSGYGPGFRQMLLRFAPISSTLPQDRPKGWSEYHLDRWQTEDGLPGNEITALLQTRDGYLWVGTSAGLARFDGERFVRFGVKEGMPSGGVLCLFEDNAGTLWAGMDGQGLLQFADGKFKALTKERDGLFNNVVMALAQDREGRLWIGTYDGLDCWHNERLVRDGSLPPRRREPISRILADKDGLWAVVGGFLHRIKDQKYIRKYPGSEPGGDIAIAAIRMGPSGRLWFGGLSGRLSTYRDDKVTLVATKPSADTILDVCETRSGDLWLGTASTGLRRCRGKEELSLTVQDGLADDSIRCLLEDREGNLWIGTSAGGLQRLKSKKVRLITTSDGLTHNTIMSLAEDLDGTIWIGSNGGGVSRGRRSLQDTSRTVTSLAADITNSKAASSGMALNMEFAPAELSYLLDNESIPSLLVAQNGTLWLGTWNSGLFRKTGTKLEQFHLGHPDDDPILALCDDQNGGLWIGTYQNGLKHFKDGVISPCQSTGSSPSGSITTLACDAMGNLWVGTGGNGLYRLSDGRFEQITTRDGLGSDFIRAFFSDRHGTLWVGTSAGLSLIRNGRVVSLTTQDGLWDDTISQILEDDQGRLWFGSNRGIFRISREELKRLTNDESTRVMPVVYGKAEGMESLECTGGFCPAGLKTRDGRLWFSTIKGLVVVDPKTISSNSVPPAPEIEELRVDGKPIACPNDSSHSQTKSSISNFTIGPGASRVELRYTALSLTTPEKVQFRYRLDPLDANWVEAGGRRVAEYPYLPPAQYRFRVTACNEDNVWSEREAVLALICQPAFWQTWWFKTLVGLTFISGVGWGIKMVATRRLKRRLEVLHQQQALEKERVRIARDIHDELGALLTGISMLSDRAQAHQGRGEPVREQLQSISENARSAVQSVDGIVWAINPQNDTLDNLANYLVQFAENFFQLTAIRCRLDVPDFVPPVPLSAQQRHHILLAVKEACNNAARHSGATEVWLRMRTETSSFSISIEDNGRGFSASKTGDGSDGLRNIGERLAEIGGRMELTSEPEQGTCVKLIVALNILHLSK